jgi:hypothetical protein
VSLTKAPVSAAATTVTGLAAFAAVAMDAGRQFVPHGTVMAHEGAHAVPGSLASPSAAKCSSYPRKAGVSRVTSILRAAQCNKAPFMYEMKGALSGCGPRISQFPGLTAPGPPVARPHRSRSAGFPASPVQIDRSPGFAVPVRPVAQVPRNAGSPGCPDSPAPRAAPPVPGTCGKYRFPGLSRALGETPRWCLFPAVKVFLRPSLASRKSPPELISGFFLSTRSPQNSARYPHIAVVIHRLMHSYSTGHPA